MPFRRPERSFWHSRLDLDTTLSILDSIATLTQHSSTRADFLQKVNLSLTSSGEKNRSRNLSYATSQAFSEIATYLVSHIQPSHSKELIAKGFHNDIDTLKIIHSTFGLSSDFPAMHPGGLFCLANGDPVDVESCGQAVAEELASMVARLHAGSGVGKARADIHDTASQQARTGSTQQTASSPTEGDCTNCNAATTTRKRKRWFRRSASAGTKAQASLDSWRNRLHLPTKLRSHQAASAHRHTAPTEAPDAAAGEGVTSISSHKSKWWQRRKSAQSSIASAQKHRGGSGSTSSVNAWLENTIGNDIAPPALQEPPPSNETDRTRLGGIGSLLLGSAVMGGIIWAGARYLGRRDDDA